ncbi:MAG: hypothetical protein RLZZ459_1646, partial [Cyanobacteriota bacterium]
TPLVVSESAAYRSAVPQEAAAIWVNLDDPGSISRGIRSRLNTSIKRDASTLQNTFSLDECVKGWNAVIKEISG